MRSSQGGTMRKPVRFFITVAVMAVVPIVGLTVPAAAYAGTGTGCNGTTCGGLDPTQSYN